MNGFDGFIDNLIQETERAILNLQSVECTDKEKSLLKEVQDALKANDIDKLNEIIEKNGDKLNTK
jgi:hypothetical protein